MSEEAHILALDQGTTSSRAMVFDRCGRIVSQARKEFHQAYPRPGWVEHDPVEIWSSQIEAAAGALARASAAATSIVAVGLANQRETTLVWERGSGRTIYPAIVWQDRRTADRCERLRGDGVEPDVSQRTGLRLDPYFSATKIGWILDHVDGARRRARDGHLLFGTVDSWLLWNLTGGRVHATDVTNASRTLLFNLSTGNWDASLLEVFGIPRAMLPEVRSNAEVFGRVHSRLAAAGVPISGMVGDQQAALFGQGCFDRGMAKNTYGTGCFLLMPTGTDIVQSRNNLLTTVAWRLDGVTEFALEGSIFMGGAVIQWLRDALHMVRSAEELNELAASVPDTGGVILVPAFAGLGAPYWDPYARGTVVGMTRGTGRAHVCRAALESIAFQTADVLRAMEKDSGVRLKELRVDGGASMSEPLMAFQSDLLGVPVRRPKTIETTARGAALFAGLGAGLWTHRDEAAAEMEIDRIWKPVRSRRDMAPYKRQWKRAVRRAMRWETKREAST